MAFRTRIDEINATHARFYFSLFGEAEAMAELHGVKSVETSPVTAGGGLWMVAVPYSVTTEAISAPAESLEFNAALNESIALGNEMIDRRVSA